jgi:SAM-dependent methyltransferase
MSQIWKKQPPGFWRYFGKRLVEIADVPEGAFILDIGSGRGSSLIPAAKRAGPDGLVIGIDNHDPFVTGVIKEILQRRLTNASMIKMDALELGFADNYFDLVLCGFSSIFCRMEDLHAVLKSGGRIALSAWMWQDDLEWMGKVVTNYVSEEDYEDLSDMGLPSDDGRPWVYDRKTEKELNKLLTGAGFEGVHVLKERREFTYADEERYWDIVTNSGWQYYIKIIERAGSAHLREFKHEMSSYLQQFKDPEGIHYAKTVLLATGTKG